MRVPQANERVQEAPANALRALFAGIGRLLSVTDKLRKKPADGATPAGSSPETVAPQAKPAAQPDTAPEAKPAAQPVTAPEAVTAKPQPETAAEALTAEPQPETAAEALTAEPQPETATEAKPAANGRSKKGAAAPASAGGGHVKVLPAEEAAAASPGAAAGLPLPNYDGLTVASLRARLRNLSAAQLGQLVDYEKEHAARADVIAMFERRIAKIESES